MNRILFFLLLFPYSFMGYSQSIVLNGNYEGKNIYIQNPYTSQGKDFCTQKVLVNGKEIVFVNADAYEIRIDSMGFKIGDSVRVEIFHKADCLPKVINNCLDCAMKSTYELVSISIDSAAVLHFTTKGESAKLPFTIEQFRWNKWIKVGEVNGKGGPQNNEYSFQIVPHSGKNQFRVVQRVLSYSSELSRTVDYVSNTEVKLMPCRLKNEIEFDNETDYEIFDSEGTFIARGRNKIISFNDLKKGHYYLNYDNKMGEFIKK